MGVDLFFALSGFLITRILAATRFRPHYYRNFYMRRVLRLVPVYLLTLVLVAVFIPHSGTFLLLSLIYLANFSKWLHVPMAYGPLWSLAVEEHFYFIWPWLVRFLNRRTLACTGLVIVLGSPALRYAAELNGWYNPYVSWFRFDGLAWGALLALVVTSPAITRTRLVGFSVVIGALGSGIFGMLALSGHAARENRVGMALIFGLVSMMATSVIGLASARSFLVLLAPLRHPWLRFFRGYQLLGLSVSGVDGHFRDVDSPSLAA
jgi:peptidoglycan/LPS O-acetylase OafA/YrhL